MVFATIAKVVPLIGRVRTPPDAGRAGQAGDDPA